MQDVHQQMKKNAQGIAFPASHRKTNLIYLSEFRVSAVMY
jgi:hypothetical protein